MEKTLNELSEELTMKAHTDILCIIIDVCIELVESKYYQKFRTLCCSEMVQPMELTDKDSRHMKTQK